MISTDHWWTFIRSTRVVQSLEGYLGTQEDSSDTPSDLEGQSEKHLTDKEDRDHLGRLDLPNRQYSDANMTQVSRLSFHIFIVCNVHDV